MSPAALRPAAPRPSPQAPLPTEGAEVRSLHESYARLLARVARVEKDLARANAELRRRVEELAEERSKLDAVLDAVPAGVVVADEEGVIVRANPAAGRILGIPAADLAGRRLAEVRNARGVALLEGPSHEREVEAGDGEERVLARRRSAVSGADGQPRGTVDLVEDRTERRRLEERLRHHETLAAVGQMSATLAHEIRNPLHAIEGFANLILRALPEGESQQKTRDYAGHVVRGVREVNGLVTDLLEFARVGRFQPAPRDLAAVVRRAAELALAGLSAEEAAARRIDFAGPDRWVCPIDETQVLQALRNLVSNALEATPAGGRVRIALEPRAGGVSVLVSDEGPGVRPEHRARVFSPFFTTKARGTGLGLAVVAKAAALHGGRATLEPSEQGALFNLWLPQSQIQE